MTRILIPRSDNTSAKTIEASDWEKYFNEPQFFDYVLCGLCISAQCPNILAVDVSSGNARLKGLHINNSTTCSVTCLTACTTNKIYAQICRDPSCEPQSWVLGSTTGCLPADSMLLGNAVTNSTTVTCANNTVKVNKNLMGFVGTGAEINALTVTYPGMLVFSTCTSNGFAAETYYLRDSTDTSWSKLGGDSLYGDGSDGCVTIACNTDLACANVKSYNNLTINACRTLEMDSDALIHVTCTLTLNGTLSIIGKGGAAGAGGGPGPSAYAGDGGTGGGLIRVYARTITGTGTISVDGGSGECSGCTVGNGNGDSGGVADLDGVTIGSSGGAGAAMCPFRGGGGGGAGAYGDGGDGGGPVGGGSGMCGNNTKKYLSHTFGAGGGGGSLTTWPGPASGGGGGGGGGQIVLITDANLPAITITANGGAGGNGAKNNGEGGGGGGGGYVLIITKDTTSSATITVAGGAGGSGTGSGAAGSAGSAGFSGVIKG